MADNIKVLIADDNTILCAMLADYLALRDGIEIVGTAVNGQEAVQLCDRLHPDIVLMDMVMPVMDGVTATRIIRDRYSNVHVIVLTSGFGTQAPEAIAAGASAYLLKQVSVDEIAKTIHAIHLNGHQ